MTFTAAGLSDGTPARSAAAAAAAGAGSLGTAAPVHPNSCCGSATSWHAAFCWGVGCMCCALGAGCGVKGVLGCWSLQLWVTRTLVACRPVCSPLLSNQPVTSTRSPSLICKQGNRAVDHCQGWCQLPSDNTCTRVGTADFITAAVTIYPKHYRLCCCCCRQRIQPL